MTKDKSTDVEVALRGRRLITCTNPKELPLSENSSVVVSLAKGMTIGTVMPTRKSCGSCCSSKKGQSNGNGKRSEDTKYTINRIATERDLERKAANEAKEEEAFKKCKEKIIHHGLEMKLVDVEYQFDGGKITFYFTADQRVDFRELVKTLASLFKTRIELRQIGVRDAAKLINGVGICGKPQCCSSFMNGFHQITTQFAKDQQLSLNPSKISGNCGRLLCCLQFEEEDYIEAYKTLPRSGSKFTNAEGKVGDVVFVDTFKERIHVRRFESGINRFEWYSKEEIAKGKIDERVE